MKVNNNSSKIVAKSQPKAYHAIKSINGPLAIIVACFLLGVADMVFLRDAMKSLFGFKIVESSMLALIIATVANFTAFMWGKANGEHEERRSLNRFSAASFALWLIIGVCYALIRILNALSGDGNFIHEMVQMLILAVLYIGTGITISGEARKIFDAKEHACRHLEKSFAQKHAELAAAAANLQENIGKLKGYYHNYEALDDQCNKIKESIRKHEESTMAVIVGKTLQQHPEISPTEANAVMEEVLTHRETTK